MSVVEDALLARIRAAGLEACAQRPPAHDALHVLRVERLARAIALAEGARVDVVLAAATLHELVNLPKSHPESHRSGDLCAEAAARLLAELGAPGDFAREVVLCIRDHAFSKGARPESLEAAIVQDADRLDAIGAVGIARAFATCTEMQRPFYEPNDPFARRREIDDKQWGLDHFFRKLLRIESGLHTVKARELAKPRVEAMQAYLRALEGELG